MFRIVCISSQTSELHKLIETVFPPAEYHVEVVKAVLDKAVQVAQEYVQAGYDIIISRGITSKILRQTMAVPVLNIDITYFDIISALNKASTYGYILEFFHYQGEAPQINDLMHMLKILKIDAHRLHLHSFTAGEDIERILNETEIDNAVILGTGRFVVDLAEQRGFRTVMIRSSSEAILNAFNEAKQFAEFITAERNRNKQLQSVVGNLQYGLILLNKSQTIDYISDIALRFLKVDYASAISRPFSAVFGNSPIRDIFQEQLCLLQLDTGDHITAELHTLFFGEANCGYAIYLKNAPKGKGKSAIPMKQPVSSRPKYTLVGNSLAMEQLRKKISTYGASDMSVLIYGESGTGKELVASNLHFCSPRRKAPFVAVNCATLPQSLLESELFGYESGSFTGAKKNGHQGLFEQADGGTIFLDEVADLSLGAQAQLLRVLQEMSIRRVGGTRDIPLSIRVIAATNVHLLERIRSGQFREDLFYRLNALYLNVPPLRERKEDIPVLFKTFLSRYQGNKSIHVDEAGIRWLQSYSWPGNVRELLSFSQKFILLYSESQDAGYLISELLGESLLLQGFTDHAVLPGGTSPADEQETPSSTPLSDQYITIRVGRLSDMELDIIRLLQKRYPNMRSKMAEDLGISRANLWKKLKILEDN